MTAADPAQHTDQVSRIARQYVQRGYSVQIEPQPAELPFDLGTYRPDLIACKNGEKLVLEVRSNLRQLSVDRLREVAENVARHDGWRFLLVTDEDVPERELAGATEALPNREMVIKRTVLARDLLASGYEEAAYLLAWSALEGWLRQRARQTLIPAERMPMVPLARHLYAQGELSAEELNEALATLDTRNRLVHGLQAPAAPEDAAKLQRLLQRLLSEVPVTGGTS